MVSGLHWEGRWVDDGAKAITDLLANQTHPFAPVVVAMEMFLGTFIIPRI
jgi:hypothetical protein